MTMLWSADLRYAGQSYELNTPVPRGVTPSQLVPAILKRFHALHGKVYAYSSETEEVEFVQVRLTSIGRSPAIHLAGQGRRASLKGDSGRAGKSPGSARKKGVRKVFFEGRAFLSCPVYDRDALPTGAHFRGPCLIEEPASTTVVLPGAAGRVDGYGNLVLKL
jgi:N-methylhydantoinase A